MKRWYQTGPAPFGLKCSCGKEYSPFKERGLVQIDITFYSWEGLLFSSAVYRNKNYLNLKEITN